MAASTNAQMGGVFDPSRDVNFAGAVFLGGAASLGGPLPFRAQDVTATGSTGSTATDLGAATYPGVVTITGASGAGVNLNVNACVPGAFYVMKNMMTGVAKIYSVGATMNGTTGTTAISLTVTGNSTIVAFCTLAGAWQVGMNT